MSAESSGRGLPWEAIRKDARFGLGILRRRPFNCLLQVTNRCNMKCSFCDFWPNPAKKSEELTLSDFRRLSRELAELGCFLISIEGGEPFARSDLVEIVEALSRHHLTALFTNGWYVTEENARALFDAGLTHCSVSIDYADHGRHDDKRRLVGTSDRAWRAVEILRDAAPRGGRQVHVMSVIMRDNQEELRPLLERTKELGVGHQMTLLSSAGFRRGRGEDALPDPDISGELLALFEEHAHLRFFREYFERVDAFLEGGQGLPTCDAGVQGFNIDHLGNVSPCIERIDESVGNVRKEPIAELHRRLVAGRAKSASCQRCWTACRGFQQALGGGGTARNLLDLSQRTRSY